MNACSSLSFLPFHGHLHLKANLPFAKTTTVGSSTSNFCFVVMHVIFTMINQHSEYPLLPDNELHTEGDALWVEGVGWLGQYHSYLDTIWEKGLPYFVRDYYRNELQCTDQVIELLNSKIRAHEETMPMTSLSQLVPPPVVRQNNRWADMLDEYDDGFKTPKKTTKPLSLDPIPPHRQPGMHNPFMQLQQEETPHASSSEPDPVRSTEDIYQPLQAPQELAPKKQPASRKRKVTPASQP